MLHPARSAALVGSPRDSTGFESRLLALRDIIRRLDVNFSNITSESVLSLAVTLLKGVRGVILSVGERDGYGTIASVGDPDVAALVAALGETPVLGRGAASDANSWLLNTPAARPLACLCVRLEMVTESEGLSAVDHACLVVERDSEFDAVDALALEIFASDAANALRIHRDRLILRRSERQLEAARDNEARWRSLAEHKLDAARQELDTFSHTVSHDLRAPVRHINSFVAMLKKHTAGSLDDTAKRHLDIIGTASRRLGRMVDDLLDLSQINRAVLSPVLLDLAGVAGEVIDDLRPRYAQRTIEWRLQPMPMVLGDRGLLRIALTHLIDNAIKFTAPRESSRIEIGFAGTDERYATFYVKDDGVGFDPTYAHKLFGVFQRLHHISEFEGTGIGLACVRRVIERHGGTVAAEGTPDRGAVFSFSLPKRED